MIDWIRSWILGLTGAAVFCAVAVELTPKGPVKGVLRTVCGVVLAAALLSPLFRFDYGTYSLGMSEYRNGAAALTEAAAEQVESLNRRVIEERLRAYILDKAQSLEAAVTEAQVTLRWSSEGVWYPVAAELEGEYSESLSAAIEGELGIPREAQVWREHGGV